MAEGKEQLKKLSSDFRKHTHTHNKYTQEPSAFGESAIFFLFCWRVEGRTGPRISTDPFSGEERLAFKTNCIACLEMIPESGAPEPQRSSPHLRPLVPKFYLLHSCQKHLVPQETRSAFSSCIQIQTTDKTTNTSTLTTGLIYKSIKSQKYPGTVKPAISANRTPEQKNPEFEDRPWPTLPPEVVQGEGMGWG